VNFRLGYSGPGRESGYQKGTSMAKFTSSSAVTLWMEQVIQDVDEWLDRDVHQNFKEQPLAQDLIRFLKMKEEKGEAIAEWIMLTGQNPRKPQDLDAYARMLKELGDYVATGLFCIQHFTKDTEATMDVLYQALAKADERVPRPL
jgi:hypothetical protein